MSGPSWPAGWTSADHAEAYFGYVAAMKGSWIPAFEDVDFPGALPLRHSRPAFAGTGSGGNPPGAPRFPAFQGVDKRAFVDVGEKGSDASAAVSEE